MGAVDAFRSRTTLCCTRAYGREHLPLNSASMSTYVLEHVNSGIESLLEIGQTLCMESSSKDAHGRKQTIHKWN